MMRCFKFCLQLYSTVLILEQCLAHRRYTIGIFYWTLNESILLRNNGVNFPATRWEMTGREEKSLQQVYECFVYGNLCDMPLYIYNLKPSKNKYKIIKHKR